MRSECFLRDSGERGREREVVGGGAVGYLWLVRSPTVLPKFKQSPLGTRAICKVKEMKPWV